MTRHLSPFPSEVVSPPPTASTTTVVIIIQVINNRTKPFPFVPPFHNATTIRTRVLLLLPPLIQSTGVQKGLVNCHYDQHRGIEVHVWVHPRLVLRAGGSGIPEWEDHENPLAGGNEREKVKEKGKESELIILLLEVLQVRGEKETEVIRNGKEGSGKKEVDRLMNMKEGEEEEGNLKCLIDNEVILGRDRGRARRMMRGRMSIRVGELDGGCLHRLIGGGEGRLLLVMAEEETIGREEQVRMGKSNRP